MFIIDFIYGITGGTENQIIKLINNLDISKYDMYLLSLSNTPWLAENGRNLKCEVKAFNYNVFNHKDPRNIVSFFQMVKYIKKVSPDIAITFFRTSYILGVLGARLAGVKKIITTRRDYGLWLEDKRYIYLLKLTNTFVKGIITNSNAVKELTSEREGFDRSTIFVIYNGIDINNFRDDRNLKESLKQKLGIPFHHNVVGIVAGLRPMKRHITFLKAAGKILNERNNVDFVIVGDGPLRKDLEELSNELGISQHVHFVGWQMDVIPFLSMFDMGVNCSANEGLSNAIMEYMAHGVPCIVSNAGGNPELVEHGVSGYIFELDNYNQLTNLIMNLLNDVEKQKKFSTKSKDLMCEKFGLRKMIEQYDGFFSQISQSNL